ncbi:hypothetical protein [Xanthobacter oligotrophicus]|uniref:hypothetical protein n=1 Tax=Xanthobacter oligotrophicus TaxID=2607286 RepID=UPI0011F3D4C6|nr:hypothetical protein [Xanthobacter oligotrophicus]MCG5235120.1 hypothetical protein [Xanthobacter oligotrophicus]
MADYYPLLVRAISSLPQKTGEGRRAVYDRARTALMRQLRGVDPPLPEGEITRERMSLEEAIRRVEADYAQQDNSADAIDDEAEAAHEPRDEPEDEPEAPAAPARPSATPAAPPAARDQLRPPPAETAPEANGRAERRLPPRQRSEEEDDAEADSRPPVRGRGEVRSRVAAANGARHPANGERGPSWKKFALWLALALLVLGGIALAVVYRDLFLGGSAEQRAAQPAASGASSDQPKIADRVVRASGDAARRAPAAAPRAGGGPARAVLLEETPGGAQPQVFEGTVVWKTETVNAGPGLPPDIGLRGDVVIPERKINMSFVLRRNTDQTLPASHTIEIGFKLPDDFPFGGVTNVDAVRMKPNQQALGTPLAGLAVRVNPTLFLVGLSEKSADRQRNVTLLQAYPWLDALITYTNNKKAVLAFEKGPAGEQAFNDAFSAWGELLQRPPAQPAPPATQNGG